MKELIANLELAQENNKEISMKLTTEQKNFDKLQEDKMNGEEELRLKNV